jgi:LAS superfamily LD-carboxypeptidase LdcB
MRVIAVVCLLCGLARADDSTRIGYRNGKPFRIKVVELDGCEIEVQTARAFARMRDAAERDGVRLFVWSGFRDNERQTELYDRWRAGDGNLAAKPGFSNHQSGRALDLVLQVEGAFEWLEKHARRYGFKRTVPGEPWHWELYRGAGTGTGTRARRVRDARRAR